MATSMTRRPSLPPVGQERYQVFYQIQSAGGVDSLPHLLDDITYLELEEVRKLARPPETVRRVMECVHLILSGGALAIRDSIAWEDVLRTCVRSDFLTKIRQFDINELLDKPSLVDYICRAYFLEHDGMEPLRPDRVRRGSQAVVAFFGWTVAVVAGILPAWSVDEVGGEEARRRIAEMEAERLALARKQQEKREADMRKKLEAEAAARRCEIATQTSPRLPEPEHTQDHTPEAEIHAQEEPAQAPELERGATNNSEYDNDGEEDEEEQDEDQEESEDEHTGEDFCVWDVSGNPDRRFLEGEGGFVSFPSDAKANFVNVMTTIPFRKGVHYFEFVMHQVGDEQWCGVTLEKYQAGALVSGRNLSAWSYYCGRRQVMKPSDQAALHVNREAIQDFAPVFDGDTIGLLIDATRRVAAFLKNSQLQGTCQLPLARKPLFLFTHLDASEDCVTIQEKPLTFAPQSALIAIGNIGR